MFVKFSDRLLARAVVKFRKQFLNASNLLLFPAFVQFIHARNNYFVENLQNFDILQIDTISAFN